MCAIAVHGRPASALAARWRRAGAAAAQSRADGGSLLTLDLKGLVLEGSSPGSAAR
jgi:hypothetical protein